ncbi:hypothetical protein NQ314_014124 [Rhamnusium bicolor]|uniref:SWIM-type domain-containing protein n=1 Tax=Rhamnusium bicolor TaxID=1586634 RepID=A0AAV8X2Z7_9CUCU|nr:hypothetical protein NQ314_014124 [Rhamnusium bicolor]
MFNNFLLSLEQDENTKEFGQYLKQYYGDKKVKYWAYCYRVNSGLNTNMHIERMHRTLKYIYLHEKNVKRLDKAIHAIMQFVRDRLFEHLIIRNKGKCCTKLSNLRSRHKQSENLNFDLIIPENNAWQVVSSISTQIYLVEEVNRNCTECRLICTDCDACFHQYICTCIDASIKWNICKHIHLICQYRKQFTKDDPTISHTDDGNNNNENNLIINFDQKKKEEIGIIIAISKKEIREGNLQNEVAEYFKKFVDYATKNITTYEEFNAIKRLLIICLNKGTQTFDEELNKVSSDLEAFNELEVSRSSTTMDITSSTTSRPTSHSFYSNLSTPSTSALNFSDNESYEDKYMNISDNDTP